MKHQRLWTSLAALFIMELAAAHLGEHAAYIAATVLLFLTGLILTKENGPRRFQSESVKTVQLFSFCNLFFLFAIQLSLIGRTYIHAGYTFHRFSDKALLTQLIYGTGAAVSWLTILVTQRILVSRHLTRFTRSVDHPRPT